MFFPLAFHYQVFHAPNIPSAFFCLVFHQYVSVPNDVPSVEYFSWVFQQVYGYSKLLISECGVHNAGMPIMPSFHFFPGATCVWSALTSSVISHPAPLGLPPDLHPPIPTPSTPPPHPQHPPPLQPLYTVRYLSEVSPQLCSSAGNAFYVERESISCFKRLSRKTRN